MPCSTTVRALATLFITLATSSCGSAGTRRFASRPIVWSDDDQRPYSPKPEARFEGYFWDAIDHMFFRPVSEVWTFEPSRDAINVNALDEVPDSSWFVNRISRRPMSLEDVARGACPSVTIDVPAPWRIFAGKPEGATPGFLFEDASGVRYVLKVDRPQQREQATGADAVVAALYHAAGYYVPCNRVVGFTEDMLELDPDAMLERTYEGDEPMTEAHVQDVLDVAREHPDGTYRAVVSRFVDGDPLGPWSYLGMREGDPNDVVPHEHRRELRGMFVLNAWVGHWDARDSNTLSSWIAQGDGGYVRHYLIDFGECLGLIEGNHRRVLRFGHTQWFDPQHVVEDWLTLGLVTRPWDRPEELGPSGEALGYFDVEPFEPEHWRPDYWNGAFERRTERDAAWMARIIARFSRRHLEAVARLGRYSDPITERELVRILAGRRRAILERYLTRLSPLADPVMRDGELCMTDLAVSTRLRWPQDRRYEARAYAGEPLAPIGAPPVRVEEGGEVCARVPNAGDYVVLDLIASSGPERTGPARVHFAIDRGGEITLAGLERPESDAPPR